MPNKITFFPAPLPDEHIFSTVARWYVLHKHEALVSLLHLISNKNLTLNPSFAYNTFYKAIFDIFEGNFEPERFVNHTLIPYYRIFTHLDISKLFNEGSNQQIIPHYQSKILAAKHWRWCCDCALEDIEKHGTTYWHVSHQIPTMIHCNKHSKRLIHGCKCGLISDSFKTLKLPPIDNNCPYCKNVFEDTAIENQVVVWLDAISCKLKETHSACKISRIKSKLVEKIFLTGLQPKSVAYNTKLWVAQNAFNQFFISNNIEETFFIDKPYPHPQSENLKIGRFIHSSEFQLPLFYLLLLKFFVGDDEEIERTLFDEEEPEYDHSTKNCIVF